MRNIMLLLLALAATVAGASGVPFKGPGLNTHGELLPIDKIKAIGIRWVRGDLPPQAVTEQNVKAFLRHYRGMPVLWILQQKTPNGPEVAKKLRSWGITDLEIGNEPEEAQFSDNARGWTAARYGKWFASIRSAVGTSMRLYGPSNGVYRPDYIQEAIDNGMKADAITWHGYWKTINDMAWTAVECERRFHLPSVCSEVALTSKAANYPLRAHPADTFMDAKTKMGDLAWCYYDGPNANPDKSVGLFDWDGKSWSIPTDTYRRMLANVRHAQSSDVAMKRPTRGRASLRASAG